MTGTLTPDTLLDAPLTIGGRSFRSRLMVGHREVPDQRGDGPRHRGVGRRDRHRRGAPGGPRPDQGGGGALPPEPRPVLPPRQHRRLLHRRRGDPLRPARPGGGLQRLREARGHRRPRDPAARHRRPARRRPHAGARGLPGARLHQRRPDHRAPARGGRLRGGHAARLADRQRAWPANPYSIRTIKRRLSSARSSWTPASGPRPMPASRWSRASTASS